MTTFAPPHQEEPLALEGRVLVDPETASRLLGVAPQTLARWRVEGRHLPFAKIGRAVRYRIDDIHAFVAARMHASTASARPESAP